MRLLLADDRLASLGGKGTYLSTVAEHLERLGHEVTVFAPRTGAMADVAERRGIRVVADEHRLPSGFDGLLVQGPAVACRMAARHPDVPRVFVAHEVAEQPGQVLPQLPGLVSAVVVMNDRIGRRLERLAVRPELVRLHQPVDLQRFGPIAIRRRRPRHAVLFGNYLNGPRLGVVLSACRRNGLEVERVGRRARVSEAPELQLQGADVVIGLGRCVLEGMACARATYVYGMDGGDGWVTPESYPALEADGFAGVATSVALDEERVADDLAAWSFGMGEGNRDLAVLHHNAATHAAELVALWQRLGAGTAVEGAPLAEIARLVRIQEQARNRARGLGFENARLRHEVDRLVADRDRLASELEQESVGRESGENGARPRGRRILSRLSRPSRRASPATGAQRPDLR